MLRSYRVVPVLAVCCVLVVIAACDTTPPGGDNTPPSLTSTAPANGAVGVPLNAAIVLSFDEPIGSLQVTPSPLVGLAEALWDESGSVATVTPSPAWPAGAALTFGIAARDAADNLLETTLSFSTLDDAEPPAAPTGVSASGREGAIDLDWDANAESDLAGYLVFWGENAAAPSGVVALPANVTAYAITGLTDGVTMEIYLVAEDAAGNRSPPSTIVTATPGDVTPPSLADSHPADGALSVGLISFVRFAFSEPVVPESLEIYLYEVVAPGEGEPIDPTAPVVRTIDAAKLGPAVWSAQNSVIQFLEPDLDLVESDRAYRFQLEAADLAGNELAPTGVSFVTGMVEDVVPPSLLSFTATVDESYGRAELDLTFNEPMDKAATQAAFNSAPALACVWTWPQSSAARCTVNTGLQQNQTYYVQVLTGATDVAGNALTAIWNGSFAVPNLSPRLVSFTPTSGFPGGTVPKVTNQFQPISWTFSEPVRTELIQGEVRRPNGALVDSINPADNLVISDDRLRITYYPPAAYSCSGHVYNWTLTRVLEWANGAANPRQTPQAYGSSFQCGDLGVGGSGVGDSAGE